MRKRHCARRAGALLALALLVGVLGCASFHCKQGCGGTLGACSDGEARGCKPADESTPLTETYGFSARPAALFEQVGLKGDEFAFLKLWRANIGIPIEDVDTFSVVCFGETKRALLVRSRKDVPQGNVMMACQAGDLMPKRDVKAYTGKSGLAVHFPGARLALITDCPETMWSCVADLPKLTARLDEAKNHHLVAWSVATPFSTAKKGACQTTSYYRAAPPRNGLGMNVLGGVPLPMQGARSARMTIDVGATAEVHCQVDFADATSAKKGVVMLDSLTRLARGMLLLNLGQFQVMSNPEILELEGATASGEDEKAFFSAIPADFIVAVEKALQKTIMKAKGNQVTASASVPVAWHLPALGKFLTFVDKGSDKCSVQPGLFFEVKKTPAPSPRCVTPPPDSVLASTPLPATSQVSQPQAMQASTGSAQQPGAMMASCPPGQQGDLPPVPTCLPVNATNAPVSQPRKATLTVGNLLPEAVVIFRVGDKGELTFLHKVPARDADDVEVEQGTRLVAVFKEEPYYLTRTVTAEKQDWVIRHAKPHSATTVPAVYAPLPAPTLKGPVKTDTTTTDNKDTTRTYCGKLTRAGAIDNQTAYMLTLDRPAGWLSILYVVAAQGVDLEQYVGRSVEVSGSINYANDLRAYRMKVSRVQPTAKQLPGTTSAPSSDTPLPGSVLPAGPTSSGSAPTHSKSLKPRG